jgi:molybdopterin molybdotransferase
MSLLSYDEAVNRVLNHAAPLDATSVPLAMAAGRHLFTDIVSSVNLPHSDNSQMDGFALRALDIATASAAKPVVLEVVRTAAAGYNDDRPVAQGHAIRIFTGAPIPPGADCIVPIEDVTAGPIENSIGFVEPAESGQYVRRAGEDVRSGDLILRAGQLLGAGSLALLASTGHAAVSIHRQARVAIVTNGDELVLPIDGKQALGRGQIFESNALMLATMIEQKGAAVIGSFSVTDSRDRLRDQFLEILKDQSPDLIVSTGGVSVGDRDYIRSVIADLGEIIFWRAAIRPGKPIVYGKLGPVHFLGLPGNPASTMVTFELFARPLLRRLHGANSCTQFLPTRLEKAVSHDPGRRSFVRAHSRITADGLMSTPVVGQGSHYITSLASANSLIVVPEDVEGIPVGAACECVMLSDIRDN